LLFGEDKMKNRICFTVIFVLFLALPLAVMAKKKSEDSGLVSDDVLQSVNNIASTVETQGRNIATITNQVNEVVGQFQTMNGDIGNSQKKIAIRIKLLPICKRVCKPLKTA
jgi:hypothetical protein